MSGLPTIPVLWVNADALADERHIGINAVRADHQDRRHYTVPLYAAPQPAVTEHAANDAALAMIGMGYAWDGNVWWRGGPTDAPLTVEDIPQPSAPAVGAIECDESMDRTYIPLPGGWEVQTKGNGSTFRICDTKTGQRMPITGSRFEHDELERMAREIHAATQPPAPAVDVQPCCECNAPVDTRENGTPGAELNDGRWVCSDACWERATADTPAVPIAADVEALQRAYWLGWRNSAAWADRKDLWADADSPAYMQERDDDLGTLSAALRSQGQADAVDLLALQRFVARILPMDEEFIGDVDGDSLQDAADACGLLHVVEVTEACGESCNCASYGDFPQDCYRPTDTLKRALAQQANKEQP